MLFNGEKRRVTNIRLKTVCLGHRGRCFVVPGAFSCRDFIFLAAISDKSTMT